MYVLSTAKQCKFYLVKIFLFTIERNIFHQYYLEIADAGC